MADILSLIANAGGAANPGRLTSDPRFLWTALVLAAVLLLGAIIVAAIDRWRKQSIQDRVTAGDQLSHFRSLYDRGEISREEFERIRAKLGGKMREELQLPKPPAPPAQEADPGGNGETEQPGK